MIFSRRRRDFSGLVLCSRLRFLFRVSSAVGWRQRTLLYVVLVSVVSLTNLFRSVELDAPDFDWNSTATTLFPRAASYLGTRLRLKNALKRALVTGRLNITVAGGSVSAGSGCVGASYVDGFGASLRQLFGGRVVVDVRNIAQGATGPDRIFFCMSAINSAVLQDTDIFVLEYAINGGGSWSELMLRQFPEQTAIILVETFSWLDPFVGNSQQYDDILARYYDVPLVSMRDALYELFIRDDKAMQSYFHTDQHHPSCTGHKKIAAVVTELISDTLGTLGQERREVVRYSGREFLDVSRLQIPKFVLNSRPYCLLANSRDFHLHAKSTWIAKIDAKPTFRCTGTDEGEMRLTVACDETIHGGSRKFCQLIIIFTQSWLPTGTADVFLDAGTAPATRIDGFRRDWYDEKKHYTVQHFTPTNLTALQVSEGTHMVRLKCTGKSTAPTAFGEGNHPRTMFDFHGLIVV